MAQKAIIEEALNDVRVFHTRYVAMAILDENEQGVAKEWIDDIRSVSKQCSDKIAAYLSKS